MRLNSDTEESGMIWGLMAEEREKFCRRIVSPKMLADAVYRRLDSGALAPHLVQYSAHSDLKFRAQKYLVYEGDEQERELMKRQEEDQYSLLKNYPAMRCEMCQETEAAHKVHGPAIHKYEPLLHSVPIEDCTKDELDATANRLAREGASKTKHAKALKAYIQRHFDFDQTTVQ